MMLTVSLFKRGRPNNINIIGSNKRGRPNNTNIIGSNRPYDMKNHICHKKKRFSKGKDLEILITMNSNINNYYHHCDIITCR